MRLVAEKVQGNRIGRIRVVPLSSPSEQAVGNGAPAAHD